MIPTALLRQTVEVRRYLGDTGTGASFGRPVSYPARVQPSRRLVRATEDSVTSAEAEAFLRPEADVRVGDHVRMGSRTYEVVGVDVLMGLLRPEGLRLILSRGPRERHGKHPNS